MIWYRSCLDKFVICKASSSTLKTKFNNCNASLSMLKTSSTCNSSLQSVDRHPNGYRRCGTLDDLKMAVHESDRSLTLSWLFRIVEQSRYMNRECCRVPKGGRRRWEGMSMYHLNSQAAGRDRHRLPWLESVGPSYSLTYDPCSSWDMISFLDCFCNPASWYIAPYGPATGNFRRKRN